MKARAFALVCLRMTGVFVLFKSFPSLGEAFGAIIWLSDGEPILAAISIMPLLFNLIVGLVLLLGAESIVASTFYDISWKYASSPETSDAGEEAESENREADPGPFRGGDLPLQIEDLMAVGFSIVGFLLLWEALPILLAMAIKSFGDYPELGGEGMLGLFSEFQKRIFWWGDTTAVAESIRLVIGAILVAVPYRFAGFLSRRGRVAGEIAVESA